MTTKANRLKTPVWCAFPVDGPALVRGRRAAAGELRDNNRPHDAFPAAFHNAVTRSEPNSTARLLRPLLLSSVLVHSAFVGSRVAVTLYAIKLQASAFDVGLLMALYGLLPMLFSVAVGRLIDRVGVLKPMIFSSSLLALFLLLPLAWPGMAALYLASALSGLTFTFYMISVQNTAGVIGKPSELTANFNKLSLCFSTSGFVGPMLAGFAIDSIGHRWTFLVLALCALPAAVTLVASKFAPPGPKPQDARNRKVSLAELLLDKRLQRVFIASGLLSIAWDAFAFAIPLYGSRIGMSASEIGIVLGAFAAATFCIRIFLPALSRRYKPWRLILVSMLCACACFLSLPLSTSFATLLPVAFALGLGLGMSQPMVLSLIHTAAPAGRAGEAVGVRATLVTFSQTAMPLMFGILGAALGMAPVFLSMALLLAGGSWYVRRTRVSDTPPA